MDEFGAIGLNSSEPLPNSDSSSQSSTEETPMISPYVLPVMYFMYISITVLAIGGNGILCYIVLAYQKMRTVTNFFIMNLAIGDILMACLCVPFSFVANFIITDWPFGEIMCPIMTYAQAVTVFISSYTMVAISIDRYIAIMYPLRPRMTKVEAIVTIFVVWLVAIITPLPTAIYSRLEKLQTDSNDTGANNISLAEPYICQEVWTPKEHYYHYSIIITVLQYVLPLITLIFTYARIAVVIWWNRAPGEAEDSRDKR